MVLMLELEAHHRQRKPMPPHTVLRFRKNIVVVCGLLLSAALVTPGLAQTRSLPETQKGKATLASTSPSARIAEGDPLYVTVDDRSLKLRVEQIRISIHGNRLLRAASRDARLQLVGGKDGSWQGRLRHVGKPYDVAGTIGQLMALPVDRPKRSADEPVVATAGNFVPAPELVESRIRAQNGESFTSPAVLDVLVIRESEVDPAYIDLAVLFANDAMYASEVPVQLRVSDVIVLGEMTGTLDDIIERAARQEGEFDIPRPSAFGADMAAIFVDTDEDPDGCGIANYGLFKIDDELFLDPRLYSVTDVNCAVDVFAHEIGHNLGAAHDRENMEEIDFVAFDFAFAHRIGVFGTIMSYAPIIDPYFANPRISFCGAAFDEPCGVPEGEEEAADVALLFQLVAPILATIGDPFAQGADTRVMAGASCRPRFAAGDNSIQWRESGILNSGDDAEDVLTNVDVICPLERSTSSPLAEPGSAGESYYVSLSVSDEISVSVEYQCTLTETIGTQTVYEYEISALLGPESADGHSLFFPRVTPQDPLLSSYAVMCSLPESGAINQIITTVTGQEVSP